METRRISDDEVAAASAQLMSLKDALDSVIFGQPELTERTVIAIVAKGHLLLEGLPGLGKTELIKTLAKCTDLTARRIQFTPDLLPSDITGSPLLQTSDRGSAFYFQKGPLFAHIVLADEINRASPKTQSALLEAMQEQRVTVMGETHLLPDPFFVLATQNPIELEGTYPLPEAQLDRFLFKLQVTHTSVDVLERIVRERRPGVDPVVRHSITGSDLAHISDVASRVFVADVVANYIARLVDATHAGRSKAASEIRFGASPRAALGLAAAARARAVLQGRVHASVDDVIALAPAVLCHRIILDYSTKMRGRTAADVVAALIEEVPRHGVNVPSSLRGGSAA